MTSRCLHPECAGTARADRICRHCNGQGCPTEHGHLCTHHLNQLRDDIHDIARVITLLTDEPEALADTTGTGTSARAVPASKPPMRLATVLSPRTLQTITGWASDLASLATTPDLPRAGRVLRAHLDLIPDHPAVDDITTELHTAARECRAVLPDERWNTREQDNRPRPVGKCAQPDPCDPDRTCNGTTVYIAWTLVVRCTRCHHEQQPDGWVAKRLVLRAFRIERKTLWRLIERGEVAATEGGLVCVEDVRTWVRATRAAVEQ